MSTKLQCCNIFVNHYNNIRLRISWQFHCKRPHMLYYHILFTLWQFQNAALHCWCNTRISLIPCGLSPLSFQPHANHIKINREANPLSQLLLNSTQAFCIPNSYNMIRSDNAENRWCCNDDEICAFHFTTLLSSRSFDKNQNILFASFEDSILYLEPKALDI